MSIDGHVPTLVVSVDIENHRIPISRVWVDSDAWKSKSSHVAKYSSPAGNGLTFMPGRYAIHGTVSRLDVRRTGNLAQTSFCRHLVALILSTRQRIFCGGQGVSK